MFYINSENYAREIASLFHLVSGIVHLGNYFFLTRGRLSPLEVGFIKDHNPDLVLAYHGRNDFLLRVIPECVDWKTYLNDKRTGAILSHLFSDLRKYFIAPADTCWKLKQDRCLSFKQLPLIMGVLNVTPDSFFDGGRYTSQGAAISHAREMIASGADIIDVGGESSRPGAKPVSATEEMARILPVIRQIRSESNVVISVDTYKSEVAQSALEAGADIINDITGTDFDTHMKDVIIEQKCPVIAMHMQGNPQTMQEKPEYVDVMDEVGTYLQKKSAELAPLNNGKVLLDPGIGFGKTLEHNLKLINRLKDFTFCGYPLLVGLSRKSFIGKVLDNKVTERLVGGLIAEMKCVMNGAAIVRVHDVKAANDARLMLRAIEEV